jgi:hypothetical protein
MVRLERASPAAGAGFAGGQSGLRPRPERLSARLKPPNEVRLKPPNEVRLKPPKAPAAGVAGSSRTAYLLLAAPKNFARTDHSSGKNFLSTVLIR